MLFCYGQQFTEMALKQFTFEFSGLNVSFFAYVDEAQEVWMTLEILVVTGIPPEKVHELSLGNLCKTWFELKGTKQIDEVKALASRTPLINTLVMLAIIMHYKNDKALSWFYYTVLPAIHKEFNSPKAEDSLRLAQTMRHAVTRQAAGTSEYPGYQAPSTSRHSEYQVPSTSRHSVTSRSEYQAPSDSPRSPSPVESDMKQEIERLSHLVVAKSQEIENLNRAADIRSKEIENLNHVLAAKSQEVEQLSHIADIRSKEIAKLLQQLATKSDTITYLRTSKNDLEQELFAMNKSLKELRQVNDFLAHSFDDKIIKEAEDRNLQVELNRCYATRSISSSTNQIACTQMASTQMASTQMASTQVANSKSNLVSGFAIELEPGIELSQITRAMLAGRDKHKVYFVRMNLLADKKFCLTCSSFISLYVLRRNIRRKSPYARELLLLATDRQIPIVALMKDVLACTTRFKSDRRTFELLDPNVSLSTVKELFKKRVSEFVSTGTSALDFY